MEANIFEIIVNLLKQTGNTIVANIYNAIGDLYSNNIAYTLLGLSLVLWAFMRIKGDGFSKDDMFKAMIWISVFIVIKVALSSYQNYMDFLRIFQLPYKWVSAGVSAYGTAGNSSALVNNMWSIVSDTASKYAEAISWKNLAAWAILGLFLAAMLILMIAIVVMTILSQLMATMLLSLCALVLPLICWKETRSVFFGWLKLYIGMSLWAPLCLLPSALPQSALAQLQALSSPTNDNAHLLIVPMVVAIFALFLLTKIPAWVSAIIGSADSSGGGSGLTGLASAGGMAITRILEGVKEGQKIFGQGKGIGSSIGAGLGTAVGGSMGGAIGGTIGDAAKKVGRFLAKSTPHIGK
ncbi:type IV secretion system protein [uncultured Helicobacter sp.]|uniref:type IV secretion system protein n=1 Tax=uncultured Helicobacter sp. TaxID=175537 RepID=UPI00263611A5|nr:type IV secretion system protein [uncultured Helicobacter sp.]